MKIEIAQINSTVGDFKGNFEKIRAAVLASSADLVIFPECSLCGYPQRDLLDYPSFASQAETYASQLVTELSEKSFLFGSIERNLDGGKPYRNVAIFAHQGKVIGKYFKRLLPAYDVFDEDRWFEPGRKPLVIEFKGETLGITICEDIWSDEVGTALHNRYQQSPLEDSKGATIILNLSASPFEYTKVHAKRSMLQGISKRHKCVLVYANCVGANDDLIFDGRSYVWGPDGSPLLEAKAFDEDRRLIDTKSAAPIQMGEIDDIRNIYDALLLGVRDYCRKQKFESVLVGLSGGIDSALVACLAVDALGVDQVVSVLMPSRFTSRLSNQDAISISSIMKNPIHIFAIEEIFQACLLTVSKAFEGCEPNVTEENMQARIRGLILMALSNKFGNLLLTTGNKSELAVGYCTLYGDMCGGLAPLSDVYKTQVYALAREANRRWQRIPESVFTKAPTAELRPNQTDQDMLPPYERLDQILKGFIEDFLSPTDLVQRGLPEAEVNQVARWLGSSEYKRYQMPLGLKVSSKAFGIGRRMPLVQRFF
jgi:NAD+ synthetase